MQHIQSWGLMHFRDGEENNSSKLKSDFERDVFFWLIADCAGGSLLFFRAALAFISEHIVSGMFLKKK